MSVPSPPGVVLSLDVGTRTIGLARSDAARRFVFPERTLARRSVRKDVEELTALCRAQGVRQLVVGLPLGLDGEETRSTRLARQVGEALALQTGLPIDWMDEQYTTLEAERRLIDAGLDGHARRPVVDQQAAAVILEDWLAKQSAATAAAPPALPGGGSAR